MSSPRIEVWLDSRGQALFQGVSARAVEWALSRLGGEMEYLTFAESRAIVDAVAEIHRLLHGEPERPWAVGDECEFTVRGEIVGVESTISVDPMVRRKTRTLVDVRGVTPHPTTGFYSLAPSALRRPGGAS